MLNLQHASNEKYSRTDLKSCNKNNFLIRKQRNQIKFNTSINSPRKVINITTHMSATAENMELLMFAYKAVFNTFASCGYIFRFSFQHMHTISVHNCSVTQIHSYTL